jgi:hypothetical protein
VACFAFFHTFKDLKLTLRHGAAQYSGAASENVGFSEGYAAKSAGKANLSRFGGANHV